MDVRSDSTNSDSTDSAYENNERYLNAALVWLRLRLNRLAASYAPAQARANAQVVVPVTAPEASMPATRSFRLFPWREPEAAAEPTSPMPAPTLPLLIKPPTDDEIRLAAEKMAVAEDVYPPPAFLSLCRAFDLSRFERYVLLLCVAIEFDPYIAVLCARAHDDSHRPHPTFALAMHLFDDPEWEAISPERPLRYWRLIEITQAAGQPFMTSVLRADERIVNYLNGVSYLDDRLSLLVIPSTEQQTAPELTPSQQPIAESVIRRMGQTGRIPLVQLLGSDSASKGLIAAYIASRLNRQLFILPASLMPTQTGELEVFNRLWQRESILLPVALCVDASEVQRSDPIAAQLNQFLSRSGGLIFLNTPDVWGDIRREWVQVDVVRPTPREQRDLWTESLADVEYEVSPDFPARLASQFDLNAVALRQIAASALDNDSDVETAVWDACLISTRPRLDKLAQRIIPKANWDDLVLPEAEKDQLEQIAAQVVQRSRVYDDWGFRDKLSRGLGISALFAGPSGTGKTMAAEVLASHLRLNLYRIDLSTVISKYIGETEKNLRALFDAAEYGGVVLFFDEADALFGKRSEVKDSHDRYANIEINYLLQRIEAYTGLAVLATNMKNALDQAFMRRLRFVVNFPFPGVPERREIWRRVFPLDDEGVPRVPLNLTDADYDALARLNLTGGSVHNIALNAAFMAATAEGEITLKTLFDAARAEYLKMNQPINEADFTLPKRATASVTKEGVRP